MSSDNQAVSPDTPTTLSILEALGDVRTMLKADGYELAVSAAQSGIELTVTAGDGCGECLVPKAIMRRMMAEALSKHGIDDNFTLRYPNSHVDA
jgi:hypothetical protein